MQDRTIGRLGLSALALAAVMPACEKPATRNPTDPSALPVNRLEVIGPTAIAPGQSVQWAANLTLADGSVKTASSETGVSWRSSNPAVVQVSQTGLVTPVASEGDAFITAQVRIGNSNETATREAVVQPAGTFRLVGTVSEEGLSSIVVPGARVEVQPGSLVAIANTVGQYRLYGVPPVSDIQISADGYEPRTFSLQLSGNTTRSFALALVGERRSLTGFYTVFVDAVACQAVTVPAPLPADLRHRVYEAEMRQSETVLVVKLTGGQFRTNSVNKGNYFTGSVVAGGARFFLDPFNYYDSYYASAHDYPSVAERLPDGRHLVTQGNSPQRGFQLTGSTDSGLSGSSPGEMFLWDSRFPASNALPLAACIGTIEIKLVLR